MPSPKPKRDVLDEGFKFWAMSLALMPLLNRSRLADHRRYLLVGVNPFSSAAFCGAASILPPLAWLDRCLPVGVRKIDLLRSAIDSRQSRALSVIMLLPS
jgi:hypothetical protein